MAFFLHLSRVYVLPSTWLIAYAWMLICLIFKHSIMKMKSSFSSFHTYLFIICMCIFKLNKRNERKWLMDHKIDNIQIPNFCSFVIFFYFHWNIDTQTEHAMPKLETILVTCLIYTKLPVSDLLFKFHFNSALHLCTHIRIRIYRKCDHRHKVKWFPLYVVTVSILLHILTVLLSAPLFNKYTVNIHACWNALYSQSIWFSMNLCSIDEFIMSHSYFAYIRNSMWSVLLLTFPRLNLHVH